MFNHSTSGGHHFPNVGLNKMKQIQPSYFEEGGWLRHVGILVLFAKASRAILNHASIEDVFSIVITRVLDLAISRSHISSNRRWITYQSEDRMLVKNLDSFLSDNQLRSLGSATSHRRCRLALSVWYMFFFLLSFHFGFFLFPHYSR